MKQFWGRRILIAWWDSRLLRLPHSCASCNVPCCMFLSIWCYTFFFFLAASKLCANTSGSFALLHHPWYLEKVTWWHLSTPPDPTQSLVKKIFPGPRTNTRWWREQGWKCKWEWNWSCAATSIWRGLWWQHRYFSGSSFFVCNLYSQDFSAVLNRSHACPNSWRRVTCPSWIWTRSRWQISSEK